MRRCDLSVGGTADSRVSWIEMKCGLAPISTAKVSASAQARVQTWAEGKILDAISRPTLPPPPYQRKSDLRGWSGNCESDVFRPRFRAYSGAIVKEGADEQGQWRRSPFVLHRQ